MPTRNEIAARARKAVTDHFTRFNRTPAKPITDASGFIGDLGADSLDTIEIIFALEEEFDVEVPDRDAENILTFGQAVDWLTKTIGADDDETCIACDVAFKDGDRVLNDASGGALHAACCGPERESYTNGNGEPLGPDDPIPEGYIWKAWPAKAEAA